MIEIKSYYVTNWINIPYFVDKSSELIIIIVSCVQKCVQVLTTIDSYRAWFYTSCRFHAVCSIAAILHTACNLQESACSLYSIANKKHWNWTINFEMLSIHLQLQFENGCEDSIHLPRIHANNQKGTLYKSDHITSITSPDTVIAYKQFWLNPSTQI